jgi:suppressor of fused-like protein
MEQVDDAAPGWDAINTALRPIYGDREPKHCGTLVKWMLGGPDPLDGISAYSRTDGVRHWHFVTYGLSELYTKESEDLERSGFGFELTFRLATTLEETDPPMWAMNFLQNLARYVFQTGNVFAPGHHMTLNGPIAVDAQTDITAVVFAADPELPSIDTPHGRVEFVQIVGITHDELESAQSWNSARFTELFQKSNPLLITELGRTSLLRDAELAQRIAEGIERDGSSMGELYVSLARWTLTNGQTRLRLGAMAAAGMKKQLAGRIPHGRPLLLLGASDDADAVISIRPGDEPSLSVAEDGGFLVIQLPANLAREMSETLRAERGEYRWQALPDFVIEVEPSVIKDDEGNVVRVLG